ncbi:hypothetical protein MIR68_005464 [Amoeboaphelidium protococcarum]|nr:hypothetical protein MIR68_005464 [Amoeboaphelidium protococcarum]
MDQYALEIGAFLFTAVAIGYQLFYRSQSVKSVEYESSAESIDLNDCDHPLLPCIPQQQLQQNDQNVQRDQIGSPRVNSFWSSLNLLSPAMSPITPGNKVTPVHIQLNEQYRPSPLVRSATRIQKHLNHHHQAKYHPYEKSNTLNYSMMKKRVQIANEFLETEETYVQQLNVLYDLFYLPLSDPVSQRSSVPVKIPDVSKKLTNQMFSNLVEIRGLNSEFLAKLRKRLKGNVRYDSVRSLKSVESGNSHHSNTSSGSPYTAIDFGCDLSWNPEKGKLSDIVLKFIPFMKIYAIYLKNYPNSLTLLSHLTSTSSTFGTFVSNQLRHPDVKSLPLVSLLLQPVQRLPRYRMLIEQLLKYTPRSHCDYDGLTEALQLIESVNQWVNERIRMHEEDTRLVDLQNAIVGLPHKLSNHYLTYADILPLEEGIVGAKLVTPGRQMIKSGMLGKVCAKGCNPRLLLLLSDGVLFARPNSSLPLNTPFDNKKYAFRMWMPLQQIQILNVPEPLTPPVQSAAQKPLVEDEEVIFSNIVDRIPMATGVVPYLYIPYSFIILSRKKSVQLYCNSKEEKDQWLMSLKQAIDDQCDISTSNTIIRSRAASVNVIDQDQASILSDHASEAAMLINSIYEFATTPLQQSHMDQSRRSSYFAPIWIPDEVAQTCMVCKCSFNFIIRRHHCRYCGAVVCSACSTHRVIINDQTMKPQRVCDLCHHDRFNDTHNDQVEQNDLLVQNVEENIAISNAQTVQTNGGEQKSADASLVVPVGKRRRSSFWLELRDRTQSVASDTSSSLQQVSADIADAKLVRPRKKSTFVLKKAAVANQISLGGSQTHNATHPAEALKEENPVGDCNRLPEIPEELVQELEQKLEGAKRSNSLLKSTINTLSQILSQDSNRREHVAKEYADFKIDKRPRILGLSLGDIQSRRDRGRSQLSDGSLFSPIR